MSDWCGAFGMEVSSISNGSSNRAGGAARVLCGNGLNVSRTALFPCCTIREKVDRPVLFLDGRELRLRAGDSGGGRTGCMLTRGELGWVGGGVAYAVDRPSARLRLGRDRELSRTWLPCGALKMEESPVGRFPRL